MLHLDVSTPQDPELHLDLSTHWGLSCTWRCLLHRARGLSCIWTWRAGQQKSELLLDVSTLQWPDLHLDVSTLQRGLCCTWMCLSHRVLCCICTSVRVFSTGAWVVPGCVYSTGTWAATVHVYTTEFCASNWTCLLHWGLELHQDVSTILNTADACAATGRVWPIKPELLLDFLHYRGLCCIRTCLHWGLSYTWTCLHYSGLCFSTRIDVSIINIEPLILYSSNYRLFDTNHGKRSIKLSVSILGKSTDCPPHYLYQCNHNRVFFQIVKVILPYKKGGGLPAMGVALIDWHKILDVLAL